MGSRPLRILVAEDDDSARFGLRSLLAEEGFEVLAAFDGQDAWEKLQGFEADLLLADVRMPRLGGLELAARARGRSAGLPVVLMTGLPEEARSAQALALATLPKPVDVDELLALLARLGSSPA